MATLDKQHIRVVPGLVNSPTDGTTSRIRTLLGYSGSALTNITLELLSYSNPPFAVLEDDTGYYDLKAILQSIGTAISQAGAAATNAVVIEKTGYGIHSGLAVTAQDTPDMTVAVASGVRYLSDGTRQAVTGDATLDIDAADGTYNRQDLIYVDSDGALQYIAGDITVAGVRTYTITTNAGSGDTFTINETTLTEGVDFSAGVDESATATNLAAALDTALDGTFSASADGAVITVTEETPGGGDTPSASTIVGTMVVTDGAATESVTTGDTLPAVPSGGISIATLNVDASTAAIETGMITKTRAWTSPGVND